MIRVLKQDTREDGTPKTLIERIASRRNALTLIEFAEYFSISRKTAAEWAVKGRIPAIQIGSAWRLDPVEIVAWLQEQKNAAKGRALRNSLRPRRRKLDTQANGIFSGGIKGD